VVVVARQQAENRMDVKVMADAALADVTG